MPKVPYSSNVVPMAPAADEPSETQYAMAAALMHQEGRLFDPTLMGPTQQFEKTPNQRVKEGHEDVTPAYNRIWEGGDESRLQNKRGDILVGKKA